VNRRRLNPVSRKSSLKKFRWLTLGALALALNFYFPPTATADGFTKCNPMNIARFGHTATLLPNGKVLVAGGSDDNNNGLASAELYDPTTGKWTETGIMGEARCYHTATLLPNGKVLVAGGIKFLGRFLDRALASTELYDPATGKWTDGGALSTERMNHSATLLPDGKVLVAGGSIYDGNICTLTTAELYDAATDKWTETGEMNTARAGHPAVLLTNGKVLVTGGKNSIATTDSLIGAELYDPATGKWIEADPMLFTGRCDHTATLLQNGKVLVTGGWYGAGKNSLLSETYDPATGKWEKTGNMSFQRASHTATLLPDGKVLITGGGVANRSNNNQAVCELYNPASGKWSDGGAMSVGRLNHTATLLPNGKVLIAGGFYGRTFYTSAEWFSPATVSNTATNSN
jgi:N-acetylneuraminic acid mutarotase